MTIRVNIGCGQSPTKCWKNYDNSMSIKLARFPALCRAAAVVGLLSKSQLEFIEFARKSDIRWADGTSYIPEESDSVDVLYSSHMLEHLEHEEVRRFLDEARRVLRPSGVIRLALPDLRFHADNYLIDGDADRFVEATMLTNVMPRSIVEKLKFVIAGSRNHAWMYDGQSLCKLLDSCGFIDARIMNPGLTMITNPGELDLMERSPESVFVEAINP